MIRTISVQKKTTNFEYVHTKKNQGFIGHWKLTWLIFLQLKIISSCVRTEQKLKTWALFVIKLPWWLLIKPLGYAFSSKATYKGTFNEVLHDGRVNKSVFTNQHKIKLYKFLGLPLWISWGGFKAKDVKLLTEKYTMTNS